MYILRTGDDAIRFRCPVDTGDKFVVLKLQGGSRTYVSETIDFGESGAFLGVNVKVTAIGTDGNLGSVTVERECHNGPDMKLIYLWSRHLDRTGRQSTVGCA
jgi:hypothetical protein